MADKKFTQLTAQTAIDPTDIMVSVVDPTGSPVAKKITFENLEKSIDTVKSTITGIVKASSGVLGAAVSATDIKTVNSNSLLGSGDVAVGDMTLAGVQSVTGLKTFDKDKIAMKGTSTGKTVISTANTGATDYTATLPAKDGTVAMTSDIPSALLLDQTTPQSVINGKPTFSDGVKFGTSPTVGAFSEGKLYYDSTYKTLSCNIDTDVNLQIGQETLIRVVNNSGGNMTNGQAVYITGASGEFPTISLAKADVVGTAYVTGVLTQNINNGAEGLVTVRGVVHDVNTNGLVAGAEIYLSDSTAGAWTTTAPSAPSITSRIGRVIVVNATTGSILVNPRPLQQLSALTDVSLTSPAADQVLKYNGSSWVNGPGSTTSASGTVDFYFNDTNIIATGTNNVNEVNTLSKAPDSASEVVDAWACTNNTVLGEAYLYNTALGRTTLNAGIWVFNSYASVSSVLSGRVSYLTRSMSRVRPSSETVTTTGTGTSRTATASSGTNFSTSNIDTGGTLITDSYLQTPQGLYRITARTSDTVVTIETPTTYANETGAAFSVWKSLFNVVGNTITALTTNYTLYTKEYTQQTDITVAATDKLGCIMFATSNNTTTVNFVHSGSTHNSYIISPFTILHGNLPGLQGGTGSVPNEQYYHLTSAEYTGSGTGVFAKVDSPTFTTKIQTDTIELGNASDTTLARSSGGVISVEGVVIPSISSTNTFTNKRITPRITTITSNANPTINTDNCDAVTITAQAEAIASMTTNLSGTPTNMQKLIIRIKDDGTARAITWGASYQSGSATLPTTTTLSKTLLVGLIYDSVDSKWTCEATGSRS